MNTIMSFLKSRKGATMAEYAVIAVLVIVVAFIAFQVLGGGIQSTINTVAGYL